MTTMDIIDRTWPPKPARFSYDAFDGAFISSHSSGYRAETWGDDQPSLALRKEPGNGGVRIRFDRRDDAWRALVSAVAGESHVETTLDGYVRDQNEVERHVRMRVVIGRMQRGDRVLIALHPVGPDAGKGITLRLDRDDARALSWAMATNDASRRRMLVFDAQRIRIDAQALAAMTEHSRGR